MAQPPPYDRQFNFQNWQYENPTDPLPGQEVDSEFNHVKTTLDHTLENLALIQRDDGQLANDSVGADQLTDDAVVALNLDAIEAAQDAAGTAVAAAASAEASAAAALASANAADASADSSEDFRDSSQSIYNAIVALAPNVAPSRPFNLVVNGDCAFSEEYADTAQTITDGLLVGGINQMYAFRAGTAACQLAMLTIDPPPGFIRANRVIMTGAQPALAGTDLLVTGTPIEADRIRSLGFGTASARPISVGFMVRSSSVGPFYWRLIGTVAGRQIRKKVTLSAANTWQYVQVLSLPGDTAGTWPADEGLRGLDFQITLAAGGTNRGGSTDAWTADAFAAGTDQVNLAAAINNYIDWTGLLVLEGDLLPSQATLPLIFVKGALARTENERYFRLFGAGLDFKAAAADDLTASTVNLTNFCPGPAPLVAIRTAAGSTSNVKGGYPTVAISSTAPMFVNYTLAAAAAGRCFSITDVVAARSRIA